MKIHYNTSFDQSCDYNIQGNTILAHDRAIDSLKYIQSFNHYNRQNIPEEIVKSYKNFICAHDSLNGFSALQEKLAKITSYLEAGINYTCVCEDDDKDLSGYVYPLDSNGLQQPDGMPDDRTIHLCQGYMRKDVLPKTIKNVFIKSKTIKDVYTKLEIIVHEASHKAIGTKDEFYGADNCMKKAAQCTDGANEDDIQNAACIGYFADMLYLSYDNSQFHTTDL